QAGARSPRSRPNARRTAGVSRAGSTLTSVKNTRCPASPPSPRATPASVGSTSAHAAHRVQPKVRTTIRGRGGVSQRRACGVGGGGGGEPGGGVLGGGEGEVGGRPESREGPRVRGERASDGHPQDEGKRGEVPPPHSAPADEDEGRPVVRVHGSGLLRHLKLGL